MFSVPYGRKRASQNLSTPFVARPKGPWPLVPSAPGILSDRRPAKLALYDPLRCGVLSSDDRYGIVGLLYGRSAEKTRGERGGKNEEKSRRRAKEALPLPAFSFILYTVVQYAFTLIELPPGRLADRWGGRQTGGAGKVSEANESGKKKALDTTQMQSRLMGDAFPEDWEDFLDEDIRKRLEVARRYYEGIANPLVELPERLDDANNVYHLFPVLVKSEGVNELKSE